jgi:hypothetical protein
VPGASERRQQRQLIGTLLAWRFFGRDEFDNKGCFFPFPDLDSKYLCTQILCSHPPDIGAITFHDCIPDSNCSLRSRVLFLDVFSSKELSCIPFTISTWQKVLVMTSRAGKETKPGNFNSFPGTNCHSRKTREDLVVLLLQKY